MKLGKEITPCQRRMMSKFQLENRKTATEAELHVMNLLKQLDERFIFEKGFFCYKSFYLADFYLPKPRKIIIEIDGKIHDSRKEYDAERDSFLINVRRIKRVIRIKNEDALKLTAPSLLEIINS